MQINDLQYIEAVSDNNLILGSATTLVTAGALATGAYTNTLVLAGTKARTFPNGVSIAIGGAIASATGTTSGAGVAVAGEGDIVVTTTGSTYLPSLNTTVAGGIVIAVDLPSANGR